MIDLTATEPNAEITVEDLLPHEGRIVAGARVLLRTDWCLHVALLHDSPWVDLLV